MTMIGGVGGTSGIAPGQSGNAPGKQNNIEETQSEPVAPAPSEDPVAEPTAAPAAEETPTEAGSPTGQTPTEGSGTGGTNASGDGSAAGGTLDPGAARDDKVNAEDFARRAAISTQAKLHSEALFEELETEAFSLLLAKKPSPSEAYPKSEPEVRSSNIQDMKV
ncbi:hypothetical protein [Pseudooceanicola sp.]|uniref:hypothetical protein n=1 Tax=Pseudooceanicola sp. TaxID=1914328 RepID=UPI0035C6E130